MGRVFLITGDRNWTDRDAIERWAERVLLGPADVLVHGDARGADRLAGQVAAGRGATVRKVPARWGVHDYEGVTPVRCRHRPSPRCPAAGVRRNQQMLDEHRPTLVVWFHPDLDRSRGTRDMVARAESAGVPTVSGLAHAAAG